MPEPITKLYRVNKPIVYHNPKHSLYGKLVNPGVKKDDLAKTYPELEPKKLLAIKDFDPKSGVLLLSFPHLDANGIAILERTKTIQPA